MNIAMFLIGGLILLSFPFIVLEKSKKVKQKNIEEAKKKFNLFLICMIPVPIIAFALLILGIRNLL